MKKTAAILLMVLISQLSRLYADEPDIELHNRCIYPTVMITSDNGEESCMGSGVIIKSEKEGDKFVNYIFTSAHVLKKDEGLVFARHRVFMGQYESWSLLKSYKRYTGVKVLFRDDTKDIALISFDSGEELPTGKINRTPDLYIGNDIYRMGCGEGECLRIDYGKVTGVKGSINISLKGLIRTSIPTLPGDSGGPVFNNYEIVGLANSIRIVKAGPYSYPINFITYVTPIEAFYEFEQVRKILKVEE